MTLKTVILVFCVFTGQAILIAVVTIFLFRCYRRRRNAKRRAAKPPLRPATPISSESSESEPEAESEVQPVETEPEPESDNEQTATHEGEFSPEVEAWLDFINGLFTTDKPRKIPSWELDIYSGPISTAYLKAKRMIKPARQELLRHGAFCDVNKNWFLTMQTYRYIKRVKTTGFTAWYGFAIRYGDEIYFENEDLEPEEMFKEFSIPTCLTVFFREDLPEKIRRNAFERMRRLMPRIAKMLPDEELLKSPYPVNLIPVLNKKKGHLFTDPED